MNKFFLVNNVRALGVLVLLLMSGQECFGAQKKAAQQKRALPRKARWHSTTKTRQKLAEAEAAVAQVNDQKVKDALSKVLASVHEVNKKSDLAHHKIHVYKNRKRRGNHGNKAQSKQ